MRVRTRAVRVSGFALAFAAAAALAAAAPYTVPPGPGYGWPVQPFGEAHPIRSTFGDPRTVFAGPPTLATLYGGTGGFSFHQGVDIVAPDGTAVYPVRSGVVRLLGPRTVVVRSGPADSCEYWHIVPEVRNGQHVVARETELGRVRWGYGHVHFTEISRGRPVNPLLPGHLSPYEDRTTPSIGPIEFRLPGGTDEQLPELVRGRIELLTQAQDRPEPHAPGIWADMPTAPAVLTWQVERASDHTVAVAQRSAFDVRTHVPPNPAFWSVYARGTRQNMPTFKDHRYWHQEGVFLFRLGVLDTRRLPDGIYLAVATARDVAGNSATATRTFLIWNRPGWPPVTPQT